MRLRTILFALAVFAVVPATALLLSSCSPAHRAQPMVIVLGFDGVDPRLCERLMAAGELPNLARLRDGGGYAPLGTTIPPQSPVAWASFITGSDPGGHGIFDFIHRDPTQRLPAGLYYSASRTVPSTDGWEVGDHRIPLTFWPFDHAPTQTLLRREGTPFWDYLDRAGVPLWIYDIPANYPPSPSAYGNLRCLSGMGVPDLLGTYGTYQYFERDLRRPLTEGGGQRTPLIFKDDVATARLQGPTNTLLKKPVDAFVEVRIYRDPQQPAARLEWQGRTVVLKEGEWSEWCRLDFELAMPDFLPNEHVSGICRFYLQQVRPNFRLYVTPINIDPSNPGKQRVTEPPEFVTELSDALGLFYTSGFQEDHKALSNGVFTDAEYLAQVNYVWQERLNLLRYALNQYHDGLLFFYFSGTDLQAHMFWWDGDGPHPVRTPDDARTYNAVIAQLYRRMDAIVGDVLQRAGPQTTLLVMSDHGFCNFRRQFNLNTWLRDNGYIHPPNCDSLLVSRTGRRVDWSRTRAYGLGLNGLYLNLRGREPDGIVPPEERDALLDELRTKLLAVRDPADGRPVIKEVYRADQVYHGPHQAAAPDLLIGYYRDYRASWDTTLGTLSEPIVSDNKSAWSADHCIAADEVPGVLFANRPLAREQPSLVDLAPTVLELFGLPRPAEMTGASVFQPRAADLHAAAPGAARTSDRE